MQLIYYIEDKSEVRELVICALKTVDYDVVKFGKPQCFFEALNKKSPDMILLDLNLSESDGMTILTNLKSNRYYKKIPVIIITDKSMEMYKVKSLESGADDFLTIPFGMLEMIARIRAILKRSCIRINEHEHIELNGIVFDYRKRELYYMDYSVALSYKEFELFHFLLVNRGLVLSRDKIIKRIWGCNFNGETRTVDMCIKSIRQKLDAAGCINFIKTIRNVGYKFDVDSK